jgi:hypothetical protein
MIASPHNQAMCRPSMGGSLVAALVGALSAFAVSTSLGALSLVAGFLAIACKERWESTGSLLGTRSERNRKSTVPPAN